MRSPRFVLGIIGALIFLVACSEDATLGTPVIKVSPPKGFCELDKTNKADVAFFESMSNAVKAGGFSLIALYPDCREFEAWRRSEALLLTKVAFARFAKRADRPLPQFVSEACEQLKRGLSDELKARNSKYVTEFSSGRINQTNTIPLGVLDEVKGTVCYSGELARLKIANTGDAMFVSLSASTFVGDQPIGIFQWTNYVDETSVAAALANLKTIYSDFAAANGKAP